MIELAHPPLAAAEAARRIGQGDRPCWFTSPGAGELTVEREFLACDPTEVVCGERLADLDWLMTRWQAAREAWAAPAGTPVAVGYLSYDLGRQIERLRTEALPASGWPAIEFRFYGALFVRDARDGVCRIWARDEAAARALQARLAVPPGAGPASAGFTLGAFEPVEPVERHLQAVERVQAYLQAGDVYQVNLARRLRAPHRGDGPPGLALFTRLSRESPAPFGLWLAHGDRALIGNSPERFLRLGPDGQIVTAPIKGTRPRGTGEGDRAIARQLAGDPKDHAEHVMIVDLERNDLGRICQTGTVVVRDPLRLLPLPSVHHLVSTVTGQLRQGVALPEILRACFPGGSITGAPKIRAMEIIDELEAASRGPYTGATGWLGAAGDFDLAIAIRTALLEGDSLTLWVGGGIVVDSSPQAELAETIVKAGAFSRLSGAIGDKDGGAPM